MPKFDIYCDYTETSWGTMCFYVEANSIDEAIEEWNKDPWRFDFDHHYVWDSETTDFRFDETTTRERNA
jgi:hypothetical protein